MTQFLPPNLLALFAPREPVPYLPPVDKLRCEKEQESYCGVADFIKYFEDPKETPAPTRVETKEERKERKRKERTEQSAYKLEQNIALWDPYNDENAKGDPFKTLFIARISYDVSESKLKREFDEYGPIRRITLIKDKVTGKQRGYAYIEYEHERDMIAAYKKADGKKIDGRRILVDVERGRTVKDWRPRRLGGGLGNTRNGGNEVNTKYSGRDDFDGRDRLLPDDRDRSMREVSREKRRSRSRDRSRRSRSRDRERRKRSRERKKSTEREVKKEPGEFGSDSARKRGRRSRSRDRNRSKSRDRKRTRRSRSRSRGKKERVKSQVKEEMGDSGHGGYGGMAQPPNMFIKKEHQGYYPDQQQNMYNHHASMPPLPNQSNPYYPPPSGPNY